MPTPKPMTFYLPSGTTLLVEYDPRLMAFVHEDMEIRNPMMSECGRFGVDPKSYGFEQFHTGGGFMALYKELSDGDYLLLTNADGDDIPEQAEWATALLGRYNKDGEPLALITLLDIPMDSEN